MSKPTVHVVGGGLAGSEAAWQLAQAGVPVTLHEMRPLRGTAAHKTDGYAELVCSNSFRSDDREHNAVGLLHAEMRRLGSLVMRAADSHQVPAGGALAVDRDGFSANVTAALAAHPLITLTRGEVALPPEEWESVILATGPLTSPDLAASIRSLTGEDALAFFDAIAPIVHRDSIDLGIATIVRPDGAISWATAAAWSPGLLTATPSQSATWSEPMISASAWASATACALAAARRCAVALGASSARAASSTSGVATTNGTPRRSINCRR